MPNGGHICCEYCTYNRNPNRRCDIFGIDTSPYILCRSFRKPKQSHVDARKEWPVLDGLKSGLIYEIDNSTFHRNEPTPIFRVSRFDPPLTADMAGVRVSAVVLVGHVLVSEFYGHTEFHVDCLMQGLCGDLLGIQLYYSASEPTEIAGLHELLVEGNLLAIHDQPLEISGTLLRLLGPEIHLYTGDAQALRQSFQRQKELRDRNLPEVPPENADRIRGNVTECRILQTKSAGPMAFVTVETPTGTYQAVVFPEVLSRYHAELIQLGPMEFFGEIQEEEPDADGNVLPTIVVDGLSRI